MATRTLRNIFLSLVIMLFGGAVGYVAGCIFLAVLGGTLHDNYEYYTYTADSQNQENRLDSRGSRRVNRHRSSLAVRGISTSQRMVGRLSLLRAVSQRFPLGSDPRDPALSTRPQIKQNGDCPRRKAQ